MARYHFTIADGPARTAGGDDAVELVDHARAREVAVRYLAELMRSEPEALWAAGGWRLEVADDAGLVLFCVTTSAFDMAAGAPARAFF